MEFEPVIGLEVHAQLKTDSKIFCTCSAKFGSDPNDLVCPVCSGMPGTLPVLNTKVVEYAMKLAIAANSKIEPYSIFARKNYFYPDLPKAYQISQYEEPFCSGGYVEIQKNGEWKKIYLTRIHLEEDAGKLVHPESSDTQAKSKVDFNRCGVPLVEIVTEPVISSPNEAFLYLTKLKQILIYLDVCDGNMEEGSLRCDANISLRKKGETKLGTKAEVKNMNSFHGVEKALEFEIDRQRKVLESGPKRVTEAISKILEIDYDLFTRAIYSEQNNIDYFLTIDPGKRKREMDRLLGLDRVEAARSASVSLLNGISREADSLSSLFSIQEYESLLKEKSAKNNSLNSISQKLPLLENECGQLRESSSSRSRRLLELEALSRKSEATFNPFCFMAEMARSPENAAEVATSSATFSLTDHST